jgi:voltage-gated potassium channel
MAMPEPARAPVYELFMLALCVLALAGIVVQHAFLLDPEIELVLDYADALICFGFAIDFVVTLWGAPNRWKYLVTWGWLDLLSSIPTLDLARWGRLSRMARIARILRGLRATRLLTSAILRKRSQSTFAAAALLAVILVIASSTAILHYETGPESNIHTADDAIWWAFATITTVGYGDRYPVTAEGRIVAAILMTAGVGLFGAFSAALAAWFLIPEDEATDVEIAALREEIALLRKAVEASGRPRDEGDDHDLAVRLGDQAEDRRVADVGQLRLVGAALAAGAGGGGGALGDEVEALAAAAVAELAQDVVVDERQALAHDAAHSSRPRQPPL